MKSRRVTAAGVKQGRKIREIYVFLSLASAFEVSTPAAGRGEGGMTRGAAQEGTTRGGP